MNSIIDFNFMHILLAVFIVIFVSVLAGLVIATVKTLKGRTKYTFFILLSVFSILIAGVSWVLNMGWFRFFMTFLLVPFIHAFLVYIISLLSVKFYDRVAKLKMFNLIYRDPIYRISNKSSDQSTYKIFYDGIGNFKRLSEIIKNPLFFGLDEKLKFEMLTSISFLSSVNYDLNLMEKKYICDLVIEAIFNSLIKTVEIFNTEPLKIYIDRHKKKVSIPLWED